MCGGSGGGGSGGRSGGGGGGGDGNLGKMSSSEIYALQKSNPKSYGEYLEKVNPKAGYSDWASSKEAKRASKLQEAYDNAKRRERPDIAREEAEIQRLARPSLKVTSAPRKKDKYYSPDWA